MQMSSSAAADSAEVWQPELSLIITQMDLQVDVSPVYEAFTQDTNATLANITSTLLSPEFTIASG
eukprot:scaffold649908_cov43-Prasinocladus_malaysianus.AAC.1